MKLAIRRVRDFYEQQPAHGFLNHGPDGALGQLVRPIGRVGVYVPGGLAPLISTLIHTGVPAQVAGVPEIIVTTPPGRDGGIHPAILVAAGYGPLTPEAWRALGAAPVEALAIDVHRGGVPTAVPGLAGKTLVGGVIDGRNIWRGDLGAAAERLASLAGLGAAGVAAGTSTSLQHVPHDVADETALDARLVSWLAFADQKVAQVVTLARGLTDGPAAIAADIADVLAGGTRPVFRRTADTLAPLPTLSPDRRTGKAYIRLIVRDQPGVIAAVTETLAGAQVSIDSFLQKPVEDHDGVPIVLTTQDAPESRIDDAVARIAALPFLLEPPRRFRLVRL